MSRDRDRSSVPPLPEPLAPRVLRGPRVTLVPVSALDPEHDAVLVGIVRSPEVARWWSDPLEEEAHWPRGEDQGRRYAIVLGDPDVGGRPIGGIAWWSVDNTHYEHAGMDLFLGADHHGQHIGREAVAVMAAALFAAGHHRIVIDPAAANDRAIRCYASVGFTRVGIMRRYEWAADGSGWQDGLLMECLPEDLRPPW